MREELLRYLQVLKQDALEAQAGWLAASTMIEAAAAHFAAGLKGVDSPAIARIEANFAAIKEIADQIDVKFQVYNDCLNDIEERL